MTFELSQLVSRQVPQACDAVPSSRGYTLTIWAESDTPSFLLIPLEGSNLLPVLTQLPGQIPNSRAAVGSCGGKALPVWTKAHPIDPALMTFQFNKLLP
jgi:hypothetical protein